MGDRSGDGAPPKHANPVGIPSNWIGGALLLREPVL
jgi:hypothetical protein